MTDPNAEQNRTVDEYISKNYRALREAAEGRAAIFPLHEVDGPQRGEKIKQAVSRHIAFRLDIA